MLLRKKEFIREMKNRKKVSLADAAFIYDVFCEALTEVIAEGNDVVLRNVGTLFIKDKAPHMSQDPRTSVKKMIPRRKILKFRAAVGIRDYLAGKSDSWKTGKGSKTGMYYEEGDEIELTNDIEDDDNDKE